MKKNQGGYIVVETIGSFLLFVLLIVSILSLVNIVTVQARMHYALTQAAQTLSMYSYTLEAAGVTDELTGIASNASDAEEDIEQFKNNFNQVIDGIKNLSASDIQTGGSGLYDDVSTIVNDPKETARLLLNYGIKRGGDEVFQQLAKPLIMHYLRNGDMSGEDFLTAYDVQLDSFKMSDGSNSVDDTALLNKDGEVKLTAHYYITYKFGALVLPFEPKLEVTQTVLTKAWLGGKGEGYF